MVARRCADDERRAGSARAISARSSGSRNRRAGRSHDEAFAAWRRLPRGLADQRPLVLVFEDLHWADDGLLDFVDHLADWATTVSRCSSSPPPDPSCSTRRPAWGGGKRTRSRSRSAPLSDEETAELVHRAARPRRAPRRRPGDAAASARAATRSTRRSSRACSTSALTATALPETVQGIIAARLDVLAPVEKELLQDAAVLGKVFWAGALGPNGDERAHSTRSSGRSSSGATAAPR